MFIENIQEFIFNYKEVVLYFYLIFKSFLENIIEVVPEMFENLQIYV